MSTTQLPVASEDEAMLESMIAESQRQLFALRKQKDANATATQRADRLERLKEALAENERSVHELETVTIPAAYDALKAAVGERYAACQGRGGLYGQVDVSNRVNNTSTKLIGLLDAVPRRKAQLEKARKDVAELQGQVDDDVVRAKNTQA
jgi:hypothetical protein